MNNNRFRGYIAKMLGLLAICITTFTNNSLAQDSVQKSRLKELLGSYYAIKDALVNGNATDASAAATSFIKNIHGISYQVISEGNNVALVKDAGTIAGSRDLSSQRQSFARFSSNMAALAKDLKLTGDAVYIQYCPMKKAPWLSSEKAIRNPYYGSAMLNCGKVTETIE